MTRHLTAEDFVSRLGGYVSATNPNNARVPAPGKSLRSDALSIIVDPDADDGFRNNCFADVPWKECRDYIKAEMGINETYVPPVRQKPKAKTNGVKPQPEEWNKVAEYVYHDKDGEPYHRVTRYAVGGGKSYGQERWKNGQWVKGADDTDPETKKALGNYPPIPYNLPAIVANPDEPIWLVEGEKNADDLIALGLLATTAKGGATSFPLSDDFAVWFDGVTVYALPDNDDPGETWLVRVQKAIPHAQTIILPGLPPKGDVSDWLEFGGTVEELTALASPPEKPTFTPTAFDLGDPTQIPPRQWMYDFRLIRGFVALTVAPGGLGKSSLAMVDALSMATGRALFDDSPVQEKRPLRVWYWNGEDPQEETRRRVAAIALHYKVKNDDIAGRLFTDTGRETEIILGAMNGHEIEVNDKLISDLETAILKNEIDVLIIDPFSSAHRLPENDNSAINAVARRLAKLADRCNCAVEIVHHTRKTNGAETTVEDGRGASSMRDAVRSARALNVMSPEIADELDISETDRLSYFSVGEGKASMSSKAQCVKWRQLISVPLGNGTPDREQDHVGVVTYYELKKEKEKVQPTNDLSNIETVILQILATNDMTRHWGGRGTAPTGWLGKVVIDRMGLIGVANGTINGVIKGMLNDKKIVLRSTWASGNEVTSYTLPDRPASNDLASTPDDYSDVPF